MQPPEPGGSNDDFITVVTGVPRSGTSMLMRMLEAGGMPVVADQVHAADDDNPAGYYEFSPVLHLARDNSWLAVARGKAVKIIYRLLRDLPAGYEYRLVWIEREMSEVLASQQQMLARRGKAPSTSEAKPFDAVVHDAKLAAAFRLQIDQSRAWISQQSNMKLLVVHYNELMQAPTPSVEKINHFLNGFLDTAAMAAVIDPALYRNRA